MKITVENDKKTYTMELQKDDVYINTSEDVDVFLCELKDLSTIIRILQLMLDESLSYLGELK